MEFATRQELNGLGQRLNQAEKDIAGLDEAMDTGKQDRRDIWKAIAESREEDKRIERLVNQIALKVAGISAIFSILTTVAVAIVVKHLGR